MADELPIIEFADLAEWERWLAANGGTCDGIWLKFAKVGAAKPTITKKEAIDGALCQGWIDGQIAKYDDHYFLTRFTPRRARSKWSMINRERAEQLIQEDRMRPAGLREIERAKADGRWEAAYHSASRAQVPPELVAALAAAPAAKRNFDALDSANRYAILYRLQDAKRPETRAARLTKFVEMLARGDTLHPPRTRRS
jgi:uncharacterized protein YdeI (YjbR/CyaY-like superfamily)